MLNLASGDPGLVYTLQQYTYRTLDRIENGNNARTETSGMSVPGATSDQAHSETSAGSSPCLTQASGDSGLFPLTSQFSIPSCSTWYQSHEES